MIKTSEKAGTLPAGRLQSPLSFFDLFYSLQAHLPFAVVGSLEEVKVGNKTVRARQYPWGVVQGKNHLR